MFALIGRAFTGIARPIANALGSRLSVGVGLGTGATLYASNKASRIAAIGIAAYAAWQLLPLFWRR